MSFQAEKMDKNKKKRKRNKNGMKAQKITLVADTDPSSSYNGLFMVGMTSIA